jgi:DNA-binding phage protein
MKKSSKMTARPYSEALVSAMADNDEAIATLGFALEQFAEGNDDEAKTTLRVLVKGRLGFEELARRTGIPARSLNRMLSSAGNPSLSNLSLIIRTLHDALGIAPNWSVTPVTAE